jgi:hypothetical protein
MSDQVIPHSAGEAARDRIIGWAIRHHLELYSGAPGDKHPTKTYSTDGSWRFTEWTGQDGPVLIRCNRFMVCLDGDGETGQEFIATLKLPPGHFAIRSLGTGGEKRFGYSLEGVRRAVRPLSEEITFDVLGNPDDKYIWIKIWDDCGYEIISDTDEVPDFSAAVEEIRRQRGRIAAPRAISGRPAAAGASQADGGELLPTAHYAEHGIPLGIQEDRFYRLADRFAAQGKTEDQGTQLLMAIARVSEQDDSDPWTPDQLRAKMRRALAWIAAQPAALQTAGLDYADTGSEQPVTAPIVAPERKGSFFTGATIVSGRACEDLGRDPELARQLMKDSWDETGRSVNRGNDWDTAPRGCHEAYDFHLLRWADGTDVRTADLKPAHLRWLERPGLSVGYEQDRKYVQFIRTEADQVIFQDRALKDPGEEFPGWDDDSQNPREGRRHGHRTKAAILEVIESGKAATKPEITAIMNTRAWREANPDLDLPGTKGFRIKQVSKAMERLVKDGVLYVRTEAVFYWRNRTWNTVPAEYAVPGLPADDDPPSAPKLDDEEGPAEQHRIAGAWVRRQGRKFSRAERERRKLIEARQPGQQVPEVPFPLALLPAFGKGADSLESSEKSQVRARFSSTGAARGSLARLPASVAWRSPVPGRI